MQLAVMQLAVIQTMAKAPRLGKLLVHPHWSKAQWP